tara:strand:- start:286 stop:744 length:459 start_codon:yes stop_codon:yes gene_type:complete
MKIIKKLSFILILIFLTSCGYQSLYKNLEHKFTIKNISLEGERTINQIINNQLKQYQGSKNKKNYDIKIKSYSEKKISQKDTAGNAKLYQLTIKVELEVTNSDNQTFKEIFIEKDNYEKVSSEFNLNLYEENITENLSNKISFDIAKFMSSL